MSLLLWPWHALVLVTAFARDLVISSLQVAKAVLSPRYICEPRFVTVPLTRARSDLEITMVANYITLTPGTLTVDVSADRSTLLVHSLLAGETGDGRVFVYPVEQAIDKSRCLPEHAEVLLHVHADPAKQHTVSGDVRLVGEERRARTAPVAGPRPGGTTGTGRRSAHRGARVRRCRR